MVRHPKKESLEAGEEVESGRERVQTNSPAWALFIALGKAHAPKNNGQ